VERGELRSVEACSRWCLPPHFIPKTHGREQDSDISGRSEQILGRRNSMISFCHCEDSSFIIPDLINTYGLIVPHEDQTSSACPKFDDGIAFARVKRIRMHEKTHQFWLHVCMRRHIRCAGNHISTSFHPPGPSTFPPSVPDIRLDHRPATILSVISVIQGVLGQMPPLRH
jgi:hypothetical protein